MWSAVFFEALCLICPVTMHGFYCQGFVHLVCTRYVCTLSTVLESVDFGCLRISYLYILLSQQQSDKAQSQPDLDKLSLQDQGPKSTPPTTTKPATTSTRNLTSLDSPVLNPPVVGPPSSLQETVGPPADHEETKLVSLTTPAGADAKPASTPPESMPKQGTLHSTDSISEAENHSLDNQTASLADSKAGHQESLPNGNDSSPELLQLDSDKYDEATYEKVGPQLGLGLTGLTSSMYAAGSDRAESRHIDFPSLASERSNDMAQPASHSGHGSLSNPPFMVGFSHDSISL